jgi:hypothetical protein
MPKPLPSYDHIYRPVKFSPMNIRLILAPAILLLLLLAVAGCTEPATILTGPAATPSPTPVPTTTLPEISATPGATEALPDVWDVEVQVQSNGLSINPQIIMTFRGGKGMNLVPELDLEVIRSDGIVETGKMTQPLYVGETVTLPGTTQNNDRAIVWAITAQGDRVKIVDKYVPFRSYNTG